MCRSPRRLSLIWKTALFGGILALLAALPTNRANAQELASVIREFAESGSGLTLLGEIEVGALQAGRQMTFPVQLESGVEYTIVGICDEDCTDLDLALLDSDGTELESDYLVDAEPVLSFTADGSGWYDVRLDMVTCSIEPCSYAVGVFEGAMEGDFGVPGESMEERLDSFRADLSAEGYTEIGSPVSGSLDEGQELRFPVSIQGGLEYEFVGVCDNDCENLDLILYGPSGEEIDADILPDAFPIITLSQPPAGEYRMALLMVSCTLEPCLYQVATFAQGEGLAPGGVMVSGTIVAEATYRGALESGDEQLREGEFYDEYSIDAEAGQTVIVDLRSPDFDTYLIVESPGGDTERNDDFGDSTMRSHIEMVAQEDGTFSILVTSFSAESMGEYTLQIAVVEGS